jgi:hypothetical protein
MPPANMKLSQLLATLPCLAVCTVAAQDKKPYRAAPTHEELASALRQQQAADPMRQLPKVEGADPSKENQPQDLLKRSDILCFNGLATLVPKRSIIVLPTALADRVGMKAGAKLVGWNEFFAANRGWLSSQEVTLAQVRGQEPFAESLSERLAKSTNVVVATLEGGPISKLQSVQSSTPTN